MLTLLHGEDTTKSRNAFIEQKKEFSDIPTLDGATITLTDLTQALGTEDLFGETKHVFIENLLSKKKSPKEVDAFVSLITSTSQDVTLWEGKELTPKQVSNLKGAQVKLFKVPTIIFTFLDSLKPGNGKQLIELFHQILVDNEAEYVLFMLQRQIRILLALSSVIASEAKQSQTISELARLAPWQKGKLEKQTKLFTTQQLLSIHSKLFEIDLAQKTGGLTMPPRDTIDFLLLSI